MDDTLCAGTGQVPVAIDPTPDLPRCIVGNYTMGICPVCEDNTLVRDGLMHEHHIGLITVEA
jgi:hypothetical protein